MQKTPYPWAFSYTQKTIAPILKLYQFDYAIWLHIIPLQSVSEVMMLIRQAVKTASVLTEL